MGVTKRVGGRVVVVDVAEMIVFSGIQWQSRKSGLVQNCV